MYWTRWKAGRVKFPFLDYKSKSAEQSKTLYLRLLVFHMQFLGYFAQGHNKFWVSVIQTEHNGETKKRKRKWSKHHICRRCEKKTSTAGCLHWKDFWGIVWQCQHFVGLYIHIYHTQNRYFDSMYMLVCKSFSGLFHSVCLYSITDHHYCHIAIAQTP